MRRELVERAQSGHSGRYPPLYCVSVLEADKERLVVPFYLQMMRTNAVGDGDELADEIAVLAHEISVGDVLELLRSDWRPRVMGAWFAAARDEIEIGDGVLASLDTCYGSLTSPPLVTAALVHGRPKTREHLNSYVERDMANEWGAANFALAAIEHLDGKATQGIVADTDRGALSAMLNLASRLRRG